MNTYTVDFEYLIPEFSAITLDAETSDEAKLAAHSQLAEAYPEAVEIVITGVTKV